MHLRLRVGRSNYSRWAAACNRFKGGGLVRLGQGRRMIDATELELEGKEGGASAAVSYRALWYMINGQERAKGSAELCKQVPLERMFWL